MCNYNGGTNVRELFSFPAQHSEINFNLLLKLHIEYNIKKKKHPTLIDQADQALFIILLSR
jgi:hypothetical protein